MNLFADVQYTFRQWKKSPAFAVTAILTLALGLGANTAIFTLLDQALLRVLPVKDPSRLVLLRETGKAWDGRTWNHGMGEDASFSYPMYRDLRDKNQAFEGILATVQTQAGLEWNHQAQIANAELVSGNYFQVLGVAPALGRVFVQQDDVAKNGSAVAVLSYSYWKSHFGSDPSILNRTVAINGRPYQIVGVSAPGFASAIWGSPADLFVPITMKEQIIVGVNDLDDHHSRWLNILARLKEGESLPQAQASLAPLWHSLRAEELKQMGPHSERFQDRYLNKSNLLLFPGGKGLSYNREDMRTPLYIQMSMVVLVLLMAAVNVASLILVRAAGRVREFSMRYALGADRRRIVAQLAAEGMLLGIAGGALALLIAPLASHILVSRMVGDQGSNPFSTQIDTRILLFNFLVAIAISVVLTLAPALQFWKPDLIASMKQQSAASTGGSALGFRRLTVCLQIAFSMILLIMSGLFVKTLNNLRQVNVGFATENLITFTLDPSLSGYRGDRVMALHKQLIENFKSIPGVISTSATDDPELSSNQNRSSITAEGHPFQADENTDVEVPDVQPAYFDTLKIPVLAGRSFNELDDKNHPKVAIVNAAFAKHFFGGTSQAVGKRLGMGHGNGVKLDHLIVGVVADTVHVRMKDPVQPTIYRPVLQETDEVTGLQYYVRFTSSPEATTAAIRRAVNQTDSNLVVDGLRTMHAQIDENITTERMIALLASSFGVLAAFLAGIGIYGVLAYSTAQRTREIGIRMALGSNRLHVVELVLKELLKLAGTSVIVTLPLALYLSRYLKSQLYNVSGSDPMVFLTVVIGVSLLAVFSAALPARRAASVNPSTALRSE